MIGFLEGEVIFKGERFCVVSTGGVGYKVFVAGETLKKIPEKGGVVKVWTHLYVREDALELYGFLHLSELNLFETLIHAPGVGPRKAMSVMGAAPIDTLRRAIASGDTAYLTKVSGIGRKTAEKIVIELKEKMAGRGVIVEVGDLKEEADALDALVALGYSQREAREVLGQMSGETVSVEKRVREALRRLGGRKK